MSNLAKLRDWPLGLSLIDMVWGTTASVLAATAGKAVLRPMSSRGHPTIQ